MYSDIVNNIKTKDEADELLKEADLLISSLYKVNSKFKIQNSGSIQDLFEKLVRAKTMKMILSHLKGGGEIEKEEIKKFLEGLKNEIHNLKIIQLCVAFEPSENCIEKIYSFIKDNIGKGILLNLVLDRRIIGGAIITYEGKYVDLSLKKRIEEVFSQNRSNIKDQISKTS